jgi:hypothetical protein
MTLYRIVADLVREYGPSTADDLMPRLDAMDAGVTKVQVLQALRNAKRDGFVVTDGCRSINKPVTYYPAGEIPIKRVYTVRRIPAKPEANMMVASVFDLAYPRTDWPQHAQGTTYAPLGAWNEEAHEA